MNTTTIFFALVLFAPVGFFIALLIRTVYQRKFDKNNLISPEEEAELEHQKQLLSEERRREGVSTSRGVAISIAKYLALCILSYLIGGAIIIGMEFNPEPMMYHRNPLVKLSGLIMTLLDAIGLLKVLTGIIVIRMALSTYRKIEGFSS